MKQSLTYSTTITMWPAMPTATGIVCIIAGVDYSRDSMGVLELNVS